MGCWKTNRSNKTMLTVSVNTVILHGEYSIMQLECSGIWSAVCRKTFNFQRALNLHFLNAGNQWYKTCNICGTPGGGVGGSKPWKGREGSPGCENSKSTSTIFPLEQRLDSLPLRQKRGVYALPLKQKKKVQWSTFSALKLHKSQYFCQNLSQYWTNYKIPKM